MHPVHTQGSFFILEGCNLVSLGIPTPYNIHVCQFILSYRCQCPITTQGKVETMGMQDHSQTMFDTFCIPKCLHNEQFLQYSLDERKELKINIKDQVVAGKECGTKHHSAIPSENGMGCKTLAITLTETNSIVLLPGQATTPCIMSVK